MNKEYIMNLEQKIYDSIENGSAMKAAIAEKLSSGKNILFAGSIGAGKSTMQMISLMHLPNEKAIYVKNNAFNLLEHLIDLYSNKRFVAVEDQADVLLYDDAKSEHYGNLYHKTLYEGKQIVASFSCNDSAIKNLTLAELFHSVVVCSYDADGKRSFKLFDIERTDNKLELIPILKVNTPNY